MNEAVDEGILNAVEVITERDSDTDLEYHPSLKICIRCSAVQTFTTHK